jgi:hypothetical protein
MIKKYWIYWLVSLGFFLLCALINSFYYEISTIIQIEFAPSAQVLEGYIRQLSADMPSNYRLLQMNTIVDCGFLTGYSLLTLFSFKLLFATLQFRMPWWIYILALITGCLDLIENIFLLITAHRQQPLFSMFYYEVVRLKWGFGLIAFTLIPVIIVYGLVILLRARQPGEEYLTA